MPNERDLMIQNASKWIKDLNEILGKKIPVLLIGAKVIMSWHSCL